MFNFLGQRSVLGVDIGTASIKIAEIAKDSPKPKLKNYGVLKNLGYLKRPNSAIQTNTLKIFEKEAAELLTDLIKKAGFKTKEVVASIPAFSVFIALLDIPQMPEADINKTMSFQIRQHIPLPVSEVAIEWFKVGEYQEEKGVKQQILLISTPLELIQKYKKIFELAGLKLVALEIESLSLARSLMGNNPAATLIADIGAHSTNIAVFDQGFLKTNNFSDLAGLSLTQAIARGLNISMPRAEELKKQRGLKVSPAEAELSTLPLPMLDAIMREVKRSADNFEKSQRRKIERIILAGGGANLLGIDDYFNKQLGLPTIVGNSFSVLNYPQEVGLLAKELGPEMAVAVGLGLRN